MAALVLVALIAGLLLFRYLIRVVINVSVDKTADAISKSRAHGKRRSATVTTTLSVERQRELLAASLSSVRPNGSGGLSVDTDGAIVAVQPGPTSTRLTGSSPDVVRAVAGRVLAAFRSEDPSAAVKV